MVYNGFEVLYDGEHGKLVRVLDAKSFIDISNGTNWTRIEPDEDTSAYVWVDALMPDHKFLFEFNGDEEGFNYISFEDTYGRTISYDMLDYFRHHEVLGPYIKRWEDDMSYYELMNYADMVKTRLWPEAERKIIESPVSHDFINYLHGVMKNYPRGYKLERIPEYEDMMLGLIAQDWSHALNPDFVVKGNVEDFNDYMKMISGVGYGYDADVSSLSHDQKIIRATIRDY